MTDSKLNSLRENTLPYPRNIILTKLVEVFPNIIRQESWQFIYDYLDESSPDTCYASLIVLVDNLSILQHAKFNEYMHAFAFNTLDLDTPEQERISFAREMYRAFGIRV